MYLNRYLHGNMVEQKRNGTPQLHITKDHMVIHDILFIV